MATDIIARGLASKANNSIEGIKVGGSPYIGDNGNWYVWDSGTSAYKDSNIKAEGVNGEPGKDGITPHIGKNGNWYIGDVDTGISATGYTTVPVASATTLGGVKVGKNLTIEQDGTLNAQAGGSTEDVIIIYKSFSDYTEEEKTNIANNLLSCVDSNNSLVKICYLEVDGLYYPLYRISAIENNIDFIFTVILGFTQIQVTYTVSTMSNTLINVTLNMYNLVDSAMSDTSENPVQNKVVKSYVDKNVETLVDVGNIDWDEVTPNTKGYIANKPFGRVNTFENTTNILFENTTHTGGMHYENVVFNIDFPSGFTENIENITMATLQYSSKTYNIRTTSSAPLKRTCTENKTYSKILEYIGEFNTESIVFKLELSKKVKRTDGTTTLAGTLTCNINDLIASGIVSGIPEDQTVNLTFGLKVTTAGTKIKVIDSAYLPIATANTLGGIKVGEGLEITNEGVLSAIGGGSVIKEFGEFEINQSTGTAITELMPIKVRGNMELSANGRIKLTPNKNYLFIINVKKITFTDSTGTCYHSLYFSNDLENRLYALEFYPEGTSTSYTNVRTLPKSLFTILSATETNNEISLYNSAKATSTPSIKLESIIDTIIVIEI